LHPSTHSLSSEREEGKGREGKGRDGKQAGRQTGRSPTKAAKEFKN